MRGFVVMALSLLACGHAAPTSGVTLAEPGSQSARTPLGALHPPPTVDLEARTADARAWASLADWLCNQAGAVDYGGAVGEVESTPSIERVTSSDVSFGLAREEFFDAKDAQLHAETSAWFERVAATFHQLPKGAKLVVTITLEDEVQNQPAAARTTLATQRRDAIAGALTAAGISRFVIHTSIEAWEGSYDGPATLDPAEGRVTFAVER